MKKKKRKKSIRTGHWLAPSKPHSNRVRFTKKQIRRQAKKEIEEE